MGVPQVVIVGRPNVGKSSVLNWLAGVRIAIVDDQPGVTRDRLTHLMCHDDRFFELVDTGGMGIDDMDNLTQHIEDQINLAIDSAAVILFVVDTRDGMLPLDQDVATPAARRSTCPIICSPTRPTTNRSTRRPTSSTASAAASRCAISTHAEPQPRRAAEHDRAAACRRRSTTNPLDIGEPEMKVAIVGRRNVGKSTFVNTLAQAERMIVSEVPGTTRDSVDVRFELDGKSVRRHRHARPPPHQEPSRPTSTSTARTAPSAASAGPTSCCCSSTPRERISKVDKQLCDYIAEQYKPVHLRRQQVGPARQVDAHREVGPLPARHFPHDALRADRVHHRPDRQEREGAVEPRARCCSSNRAPASPPASSTACSATRSQRNPPPLSAQPHAEDLLRHASRRAAADDRAVLQRPDARSRKPYQRYLLGKFRDELNFPEVPIKLYLRRRHPADLRDEVDSQIATSERESPAARNPAARERKRPPTHRESLASSARRINLATTSTAALPPRLHPAHVARDRERPRGRRDPLDDPLSRQRHQQRNHPRRSEADHFAVVEQLLPVPTCSEHGRMPIRRRAPRPPTVLAANRSRRAACDPAGVTSHATLPREPQWNSSSRLHRIFTRRARPVGSPAATSARNSAARR